MDVVHVMDDRLVLPQTTGMKVMDERTEMRQRKEWIGRYLPLLESFPQPLEAGGIKVKMLNETKGEETNTISGRPTREKGRKLSVKQEESIIVQTNIHTHSHINTPHTIPYHILCCSYLSLHAAHTHRRVA